ncbi:MAG TPA: 50S ribosomal protein L10 [Ignavibacteria bacterium]|nr:50S ribosomal protein L10 [Ignavibacteria bacterium]HMR41208.1 50S ribosomal protein L10 [Ignavibacteria bacterium]
MNKEQKAESVREIRELIESSEAMYFTDFAGLTVEEVNELRQDFYKSDLKYKVVKNTLTSRALKESEKYSSHLERLDEILHGPTSIVFAYKNPVAPAKILKKFADKIDRPKLKLAIVENEIYDSKQLNTLASLPSKEEIISSILGSLDSPASGIVGSINATMRDLFSVIEEVGKKNAA